jgi:hypothetical protein
MFQKAILLVLGIVYSSGILVFMLGGGGHGSYLIYAGAQPAPLGLLIHPMAFVCLASVYKANWNGAFLSLVILHYLSLAVYCVMGGSDELNHTIKIYSQDGLFVIVPAAWYLAGQIILWGIYSYKRSVKNIPDFR